MTFDDIMAVYLGSDGQRTKAMYARLAEFAPRGSIAVKLLQACKASERAKLYRGSRYRHAAYDKKDWALAELCRTLLSEHGIIPSWGWGFDPKAIGFEHVLYVDIPGAGQISFHTSYRRDGHDYAGAWDGMRGTAPTRICRWAEAIFDGREVLTSEGDDHGPRHSRSEASAAPRVGEEQAGTPESTPRQEAFDI
ncbi:hypothetical protein [Bradyrhizobium sp.]